VVVLFAINILNFYDRHVPGALVEPMRKEFHLNRQPDRPSRQRLHLDLCHFRRATRAHRGFCSKKLLAWGVVIWTAMTASAGLATTYAILLLSRVGVGVGEAACAPTATSWLGDLFPQTRRSRVLALFMLGVPVGGALGFFFSGPIAQAYGWRTAMVFAAVPALLLVPALLMLQEPERGASESHRAPQAFGSMWSVLRIPTMWWIMLPGPPWNIPLHVYAKWSI
jgi:MFS family permease